MEVKLTENHGNLKAQVFHYLATKFCKLIAVGNKWVPRRKCLVGHRPHFALQKLVVFLCSNELERLKDESTLYVEHYVSVYVHTYLEQAMTLLRTYESRMNHLVKKSRTGKFEVPQLFDGSSER
jgi:hypothetical protein